jgi:signal transduction histidine kinase
MLNQFAMRPPPPFRMSRRTRLLIPVIISLVVQLPASMFWLFRAPVGTSLISLALAIAGPLALLVVRRFPGPVVAFVAAAACADFFLAESAQGPPYVALAFAIVLSIAHGARIWAWISVGVCWIGTVTGGLLLGLDWHPARIAVTTLGILVVFGVGEAVRTRRENFEKYRSSLAQRRLTEVQAERVRIARELHDVLAHSLSQINVQAGVGLHLMDKQPEKAAEALASIKETSKTALDEVRSVLGMLRAEGGTADAPLVPEPDLDRLPALIETASTGGLDVRLDDRLAHADVPAPVQLALYRIVQESLTNVARHASGAARVDVVLDRVDDAYRVEVRDDGSGAAGSANESGGRGVLGMRERAELLGGHLSAGPAPGGGFVVAGEISAASTPFETRSPA